MHAPLCQACAIRNRAICADLDSEELSLLNSIGRQRRLRAGEQLLWEGDEAVLVANVVEGVLKLSTFTADGKEQILGLVYPSDFLGRPFGETTPYGVEALTDAHVCVFQRADFDRFAREHPRLEHKLLERTLAELDRTRRWMLLLGRMSAEQKLASFLLEMEDRMANGGCAPSFGEPKVWQLPLSRQQIADVLGLTIETVSRQFSRMKADGLIDLPSRREVVLLEREALTELSG
ncbi:helix-turn-helix domain-containing protein [Porphyrobacter algicida]|uniref:Helix-turn-helix domain-containing protein n=1 Tax=Qipengyuania algicida TaxID=1836209 RepID=A0A845ALK1_9SPHN|nr:Crp/Fnr family transcriptional regulator [Qipengyuania algicida]MXP30043.1 helix-turn-helix domain-containing protein [Qipengyuania algicida]